MLIKFFRSSFLIQYFVLLIITGGIWFKAFMQPAELPVEQSFIAPFWSLLFPLLKQIPGLLAPIALFFIFSSALALNSVLAFHELIPKNSLLPSLLFILFMSSSPCLMTIYPSLLMTPILIYLLHLAFRMYEQSDYIRSSFSAGLLISLMSMLYTPAVFLVILFFLVFLVFGILSWREWVILIIGFFLPFFYLAVYYFWTDKLLEAASEYIGYFIRFFNFHFDFNILQLATWGLFIVLMLIPAIYRISSTLNGFNINFRKKMTASIWLLLISAVLIPSDQGIAFNNMFFLPSTILIAHHYSVIRKSYFHDIILLVFITLIVLQNFFFI